jgi:hypothetical protein
MNENNRVFNEEVETLRCASNYKRQTDIQNNIKLSCGFKIPILVNRKLTKQNKIVGHLLKLTASESFDRYLIQEDFFKTFYLGKTTKHHRTRNLSFDVFLLPA